MRRAWPITLLLAANLLWGSSWVVAKLALDDLTPLQVSAWRMIVAALFALPWLGAQLRAEGGLPPREWPMLVLLGVLGFAVSKFLNFWGLNLTTATNASLLMAMEPLFTIALGRLLLAEVLGARRVAGFVAGALGAYLIVARSLRMPDLSAAHVLGDLVFMSGLLGEAGYSVLGKSLLRRHSAALVTAATIVASGAVWLPFAAADGLAGGWPALTGRTVAAMLFLSLGCTIVAFWAWFHVLERMDVAPAALTIFVQPVWGALLGRVLLGEPVTAATVIGGALVLLSLYLALAPGRRAGAPAAGDALPPEAP